MANPTTLNLACLRQCHALEHGTVWVLAETQPQITLGGTATDHGFYIYGAVEPRQLEQAVQTALERFKQGEAGLAVHPRCGTNLSVRMVLTLGLSLGCGSLLPRRPLPRLLGVGLAVFGASLLARDLGALTQRHLTTAIPHNLVIQGVTYEKDWLGRGGHFVRVGWVN
ncbi:DUF6391 domain-containing protein [Candidatus Cyanaurora vandensis]|uniref:DUF6391 domain-containing protein n=1 Tax=Candidatus Cyanaurora vandensis TaxID=2714958 RepID=UPI00257C1A7B|nr:DUF6391 domain-containing protein [Candidatus Cyanaurora vandensis]